MVPEEIQIAAMDGISSGALSTANDVNRFCLQQWCASIVKKEMDAAEFDAISAKEFEEVSSQQLQEFA